MVVRAGISNQLSSTLDQKLGDRLRAVDGVAQVAPSLMDTVGFEQAQIASALINGWESGSLLFRGSHLLEGRTFGPGEGNVALLGRVLALNLGKKVGDDLDVAGEPFRVIGVYESDSLFESGALIVPLATLQRMMGREGQVTGFVIQARSPDPVAIADLRKRIEAEFPGVAATPARDHVQRDVQIRLAKVMAWATTVLALLLGSVGMLNTMIMAVFERTQEIGVLRALGWRRRPRAAPDPGRVGVPWPVRCGARDGAGGGRTASPAPGTDGPGVHRPQLATRGPLLRAHPGPAAEHPGGHLPGRTRRVARSE